MNCLLEHNELFKQGFGKLAMAKVIDNVDYIKLVILFQIVSYYSTNKHRQNKQINTCRED